jgi:GntR family transcriptional regulator of gluconate operon
LDSAAAENRPQRALERIKRTSISESAYRAIREGIVSRRFAPGEQLIEARLAAELEISRGPVREALARLRDEGLLVDEPHRGAYVRSFTLEDIVDIYNVRIGLEAVAVRLAIRGDAPLDGLHDLIGEMEAAAAVPDLERLSERELAFHQTLCDLSGNLHISSLFRSISAQVQMAVTLDNAGYDDPADVAREHEPVLDAISRRDEGEAARLIVDHIVGSLSRTLEGSASGAGIEAAKRRLLVPLDERTP